MDLSPVSFDHLRACSVSLHGKVSAEFFLAALLFAILAGLWVGGRAAQRNGASYALREGGRELADFGRNATIALTLLAAIAAIAWVVS